MTTNPRLFVEDPHTFLMTRSTNMDQARLAPDDDTDNSFMFHAGYESERNGIDLNLVVLMPNQYNLIGTTQSEKSDIAKFAQNFHSILARELNQSQGQNGYFWRDKSYFYQPLHTLHDLLEVSAMVITKPVRDGLVDDPRDWLGLDCRPDEDGGVVIETTRPTFCGNRSRKPAEIKVRLIDSPLIARSDMTRETFYQRLTKLVQFKVAEYIAARALNQMAGDIQPLTHEQQQQMDPLAFVLPTETPVIPSEAAYHAFCEVSEHHAAFREQTLRFRRAYRVAFQEWQEASDKNSVNFPIGTYKMRVIHHVPCTAVY